MAKVKSGSFILDSGEKIKLNGIYIDQTTASGFLTIHASGYYYGDGSNLTGIARELVDFNDTPVNYTGEGDLYLQVNSSGDSIEFSTFSGTEIDSYTISQVDTISGSLQTQIDALNSIPLGGGIDKAGIVTLTSGIDNQAVTYGTSFLNDDYSLSISMSNVVDSIPSIYSCTISAKTADGFTVSFSGDIDSDNYSLEWMAVSSGTGSGSVGSTAPVVGNIAAFAGGYISGSDSNIIEYVLISTPGDSTNFGDLTISRFGTAGCANGENSRGIFGGGSPATNVIDYITIPTPSDATDFGDVHQSVGYLAATSNSSNERGIFMGFTVGVVIDYITISTPADASAFGNISAVTNDASATSNATNERGIFGGGVVVSEVNTIEYITISTTGNSTNFGDLVLGRRALAAASNGINERAVFVGGRVAAAGHNTIEYITISTTSDTTDFGDLSNLNYALSSTSNGTGERGLIGGGTAAATYNIIEYITISTPSNATDFGDLSVLWSSIASTSNN